MPQKFYRRRSKLIPEDWTEEIERWERYYMNDKYQIERRRKIYEDEIKEKEREERRICVRMIFEWEREKEEKRRLKGPDGKFCGHYKKAEMDGYMVCLRCGLMLERIYGCSNGYNHKNHVMRGRKK